MSEIRFRNTAHRDLPTWTSNEQTAATSTISTDIAFPDSETEYLLVLSSVTQAAERISNLMLRFLPVVLFIIILLSILSAFICSKVIVTPIAKISQISKRMTSLDMTFTYTPPRISG